MATTLQVNATILAQMIKVSIGQFRPLMIWGAPGVAKTATVQQGAKLLDAQLLAIHLSQYDSVDLRGIPSISTFDNSPAKWTTWQPPSVLPFVGNPNFSLDRPIILFLDELPQAMAAVQAPAMQLVLDQRIGEHELMPNVHVIAAGNLESHKSGSNNMLAALRNRFRHVELIPSIDSWKAWAEGANIDPRLIAFLSFRPELLHQFMPDGVRVTDDKAFATPRTWEWVSRTISNPNIPRNMRLLCNIGDVGEAAAAELESFLDLYDDMPDMDEVFTNAATYPVPPADKPAMLYALTSAISIHCSTAVKFTQIQAFITRLPIEYGMRTIKDICVRNKQLVLTEEFNRFCVERQELFSAD